MQPFQKQSQTDIYIDILLPPSIDMDYQNLKNKSIVLHFTRARRHLFVKLYAHLAMCYILYIKKRLLFSPYIIVNIVNFGLYIDNLNAAVREFRAILTALLRCR